MKLSTIQEMALPTLRWLISNDTSVRATGRTTALAYAFIEYAVINMGEPVDVWDHVPGFPSIQRSIVPAVLRILKEPEFSRYIYRYHVSSQTITITGVKNDS